MMKTIEHLCNEMFGKVPDYDHFKYYQFKKYLIENKRSRKAERNIAIFDDAITGRCKTLKDIGEKYHTTPENARVVLCRMFEKSVSREFNIWKIK